MRDFLVKLRMPLILSVNAFLTCIALLLALGLRFDFDFEEIYSYQLQLLSLILITLRLVSYIYFSLNQSHWRYSSVKDLKDIIKAHALSSAFLAASIYIFQIPFPRSCIVIEYIISVFFAGGGRLFVRSLSEYFSGKDKLNAKLEARDTVILGGGNSGHLLIKLISNSSHIPYIPVGILDDSERLIGTSISGVKVLGQISLLDEYLNTNPNIGAVLSAIPSITASKMEVIKEICHQHSVTFKKLQSFEDIACLDAGSALQDVSIESVLDKETSVAHEKDISIAIHGKKVLVTGAGGSIGSEIVRQIIGFGASKLILLDQSEYNLYKLANELRDSSGEITYSICNVRDKERLALIFSKERPEIVYHAAAYKHVPLMEDNCYEAFVNNIIGTRNVYQASIRNGVRKFVLISTDKAVDPSSVMGCTKKIAELMLQYLARSDKFGTDVSAVRFGNVINSNGSVIPLFKEQIAKGGPITVTHPDMERYFMSITEAVKLVLTAGTLGEDGEIYVLNMGKKLKIVDVAKKMLTLYGRRDLQVIYTGLRPGEKMTEELLCQYEDIVPTRFEKISKLVSSLFPGVQIVEWIEQMEKNLASTADERIGIEMKKFIKKIEDDLNAKSAAS
jgi:FlaA1/EpsC-like NDP-sugar epimerase